MGGEFIDGELTQIIPGFYFNHQSKKLDKNVNATKGVVAFFKTNDWGEQGKIVEIERGSDIVGLLGHDISKLEWLEKLFQGNDDIKGASKVLLYRPTMTGSVAATGTITEGEDEEAQTLSIEALYKGTRGNDIVVQVTSDGLDYVVKTILDGMVVDKRTIQSVSEYKGSYIKISGDLAIGTATLSGGTAGTEASNEYANFLDELDKHRFNVLCYEGSDDSIKASIVAYVNKCHEEDGRQATAVLTSYSADNFYVTSIGNGFKVGETIYNKEKFCYWFAGMSASCPGNKTLLYQVIPNATDAYPRYTNKELEEKIKTGQVVCIEEYGEVKVLKDVNTFLTTTDKYNKFYKNNQQIRIICEIGEELQAHFSTKKIGKLDFSVDNEEDESSAITIVKAYLEGYFSDKKKNGYISDWTYEIVEGDDYVAIKVGVSTLLNPEKYYFTLYV